MVSRASNSMILCASKEYYETLGQICITANNSNGLPTFQDYHSASELSTNVIPHLHQAIIPSYRFKCCGNITAWGVDVQPDNARFDEVFTLDLQVWRPSPTVEITGCYSLVGNNSFTSVELHDGVATVAPLPQQRIQFQPGDVLGFYVESARRETGGVVLLSDLELMGDRRYETEEVWYARHPEFGSTGCPYPVGSSQILNTFTRAAPVVTLIISEFLQPVLLKLSYSLIMVKRFFCASFIYVNYVSQVPVA